MRGTRVAVVKTAFFYFLEQVYLEEVPLMRRKGCVLNGVIFRHSLICSFNKY